MYVPVVTRAGHDAGRDVPTVLGAVQRVEHLLLLGVVFLLAGRTWRAWRRAKN